MTRRSIAIDSLSHVGPLPVASRVGPLVESSIVNPYDPGTRDLPDTFAAQVANLFVHIGQVLVAAGGGWDDLAKVTFFVADPAAAKGELNPIWVEHFPDPATRPARHTQAADLAAGVRVSCVFTAFIQETSP